MSDMDLKPREYSPEEKAILEKAAESMAKDIETDNLQAGGIIEIPSYSQRPEIEIVSYIHPH